METTRDNQDKTNYPTSMALPYLGMMKETTCRSQETQPSIQSFKAISACFINNQLGKLSVSLLPIHHSLQTMKVEFNEVINEIIQSQTRVRPPNCGTR